MGVRANRGIVFRDERETIADESVNTEWPTSITKTRHSNNEHPLFLHNAFHLADYAGVALKRLALEFCANRGAGGASGGRGRRSDFLHNRCHTFRGSALDKDDLFIPLVHVHIHLAGVRWGCLLG
jgi:hypothetical protein